jgi:hypothetical protein
MTHDNTCNIIVRGVGLSFYRALTLDSGGGEKSGGLLFRRTPSSPLVPIVIPPPPLYNSFDLSFSNDGKKK